MSLYICPNFYVHLSNLYQMNVVFLLNVLILGVLHEMNSFYYYFLGG